MRRGGQISGLVSLVLIFCVLFLCVFSVLTLSAAQREQTLSKLSEQRTAEYYAADRAAVERIAALREPSVPDGTEDAFRIPAGENLSLEVQARKDGGAVKILRWETVYSGSWKTDDTIIVWDGN